MQNDRHPTPPLVHLCFQSPADSHLHPVKKTTLHQRPCLTLASPDPVRMHFIRRSANDNRCGYGHTSKSGSAPVRMFQFREGCLDARENWGLPKLGEYPLSFC
jgi:hypothetical protein